MPQRRKGRRLTRRKAKGPPALVPRDSPLRWRDEDSSNDEDSLDGDKDNAMPSVPVDDSSDEDEDEDDDEALPSVPTSLQVGGNNKSRGRRRPRVKQRAEKRGALPRKVIIAPDAGSVVSGLTAASQKPQTRRGRRPLRGREN